MHPNKKDASASHNAKMRRMTRDYGSAGGPSMNKMAPMDRLKEEGPEQPVGFGAEYDAASARGDRSARRSVAANPLATYSKGGKVRERAFGGRLDNKSPAAKKGATNVNVIIAPQGGAQPTAMAPVPPPPGPPVPPSAPPAPPSMLPPGMGAAMPPGGAPPGMMPRAKGGRVTGYDAGAGSGEGRLEKIEHYGRKVSKEHPQVV